MFKHHKFCVVDVLGLLIAHEDQDNFLNAYLLDGAADTKAGLPNHTQTNILATDPKHYSNRQRIKVSDSELLKFIRINASPSNHPVYKYIMDAHITGTLDLDNSEVQFHDVCRAIIKDNKRTLIYEPK